MGYYTTLEADVVLSKDAPIKIIKGLVSGELTEQLFREKFGELPNMYAVAETPNFPIDHPFGKSSRWPQIFNPHTSTFNEDTMELSIRCEIKAYDNIYNHLVSWLDPYIISGLIRSQGEDYDSNTWDIDLQR